MKRRLVLILLLSVFALAGLVQPQPAQAVTMYGGSIVLTCTNFFMNLKYYANRNNTGTGREHYAYVVTDGAGTVLGTQEYTDNFNSQDNYVKNYAVAPKYNPITAVMTSFAGNGLGVEVNYSTTYDCPGLPFSSNPRPIPDGFVLKTITCDVAVFATPGGIPVGDNAVKSGQTWYVSPSTVKGADGKGWYEIYVSGTVDGYVPAACVK